MSKSCECTELSESESCKCLNSPNTCVLLFEVHISLYPASGTLEEVSPCPVLNFEKRTGHMPLLLVKWLCPLYIIRNSLVTCH